MSADSSRVLGYVLSDPTTRMFKFIVAEGAEGFVSEGIYVVVEDKGRRFIATISSLSYYHEFYDEKDIWAEAVKKGHRPPVGVGRSFLLGKAVIVGEVDRIGVKPPVRPPRPGSSVMTVSPGDLKKVFGHDPSDPLVPEHLLSIGSLQGYSNMRAFIDLKAVTMHLSIIGTTGSGKTNTVSVILEELGNKNGVDTGISKLPRTIPAIVMDLNADYLYLYHNPDLVPSYSKVIRMVSRASPAWMNGEERINVKSETDKLSLDLDALESYELAEAAASFYKGSASEGSALAIDLLTRVFDELLPAMHYSRNDVFSNKNLLEKVKDKIEREYNFYHRATIGAAKRMLDSLYNTLQRYKLVDTTPTVNREFIDNITDPDEPKLVLFDLSSDGLPGPMNVKQFIVYYIGKLLFSKFIDYRSQALAGETSQRVALFIIEEAQNFAPNLQMYKIEYNIAKSVLATIATQGRKFGMSLVLVTQRPVYVDPVIMSMMNTFIIHRIAPFDLRFVDNVTGGLTLGFSQNLATMERGTVIIVGQMNPSPHPVIARVRKRKG